MNKYIILIFACLFKLSLFTSTFNVYRPMSKKSIDFGEDVCYYEDISDNSKLMYVKGCPSGKTCQIVEQSDTSDTSVYRIHVCQQFDSISKRKTEETCDTGGLDECEGLLTCTSGTCKTSGSTTTVCAKIGKRTNGGTESCVNDETEINTIGNKCYSQDTSTSNIITYTHYISPSKICKKLTIQETSSGPGAYYIKSKELVDGLYSIQDGGYVDDDATLSDTSNIYCESGFSLYFYGNGKLSPSDTKMFKRCVKFLAIEKITNGYMIKYELNEKDHIYDTSQLTLSDYKTKQDKELYLLYTRAEISKNMKEEYKANGESNTYKKWEYLYADPEKYLLYKDQPEILDYLIQKYGYPNYIPEGVKTSDDDDTTTNQTNTNETVTEAEPNNQSSGFLNIHNFIISLFLFAF